jgi:hypothetical protein
LQGELQIADGELRFLGGGVYETARYDLATLACLNAPRAQVTSQYRTAFYPYYPTYGKFVSLEHSCADGSLLCHEASYEGSAFSNLALQAPQAAGTSRAAKDAARDVLRRRGQEAPQRDVLWQDQQDLRFTSFVVGPNYLLATGHSDSQPDKPLIAAIDIRDGRQLWQHPLPADAVKGGSAVDARGQIYVTLENGQLVSFRAP